MTWAFEMRRDNGAVVGIERFDFGFSEEECIGVYGLDTTVVYSTGLMLEDSPWMLQNEMGKSLGATLVAVVELFFILS